MTTLPAGWTRSYVDWHRAQEPARFEADMAEMREMADRIDSSPFRTLLAPKEPFASFRFSLMSLFAHVGSAQLAADLELFRQLAVSIAASGPSSVEQRALVAARVFGAL